MAQVNFQDTTILNKNVARFLILAVLALAVFYNGYNLFSPKATAQTAVPTVEKPFKIGEKLTYTITYDRFKNAGYAEIQVVSKGKLNDSDAFEITSKFKTDEFVSAAFYLIDESRTVFASAQTGLPLYVSKTSNASVFPEEKTFDFRKTANNGYDLVTLIYALRQSGGTLSASLIENEKNYLVTSQTSANEKIQTDAGEFETTQASLQSEYLTEKGISDFRINLSSDARKIPVMIRFKVGKGEFRLSLASFQMAETESTPALTPTPTPVLTPVRTPTPAPTPKVYENNQPLSPDIPFSLSETLEYQVSAGGKIVGNFVLMAKERKEITVGARKLDSLLLEAFVISSNRPEILNKDETARVYVNPENLQPILSEVKFGGLLNVLNQSVRFDQNRGIAVFDGTNQVQIPVNTHSLLSLIYAIRSFNLRPSKDITNPVNDTRVAVFYGRQFYVFMLRPSGAQIITLQGNKISAQQITVITGNPTLDSLNLRLWLSNENRRTPLRLMVGNYQIDLVAENFIKPK